MYPKSNDYFEELEKEVKKILKKKNEDITYIEQNLVSSYILMIKYIKERQK